MTACGTPFYFSPELVNSQPYREPSDVWALGVLLYELLTLQRPFNGGNIAVLALNITNGTYDEEALNLSPYPQWVRRLASKEKLLHPDPHRRLPLPELLAAVGGLEGDESEASLLALQAQAPSSPPPSIVRVQPSLRGADTLPSSIHEEDVGPGRDGLSSPSEEKLLHAQLLLGPVTTGVTSEHATNNAQLTGPVVLGTPMKAEEPSTSKDHAAIRGEDLDDLDTVYATQSPPPLEKDRKLDGFADSTGSV